MTILIEHQWTKPRLHEPTVHLVKPVAPKRAPEATFKLGG